MGTLGVTPKQVERARQTFMKSAEFAQFIDRHTGVFVQPGFPSDASPKDSADPTEIKDKKSNGGGMMRESAPNLDPLSWAC